MKHKNSKKKFFKILHTCAVCLSAFFLVSFFGNVTLENLFLYGNIIGYHFWGEDGSFFGIDVFNEDYREIDVAGENEVSFYEEGKTASSKIDLSKLKNLSELKKSCYIVDKKTLMTRDYFDIDKFMSADLKIKKNGDFPKVLIFHTHSHEMFKDSNPDNLYDGIVGAGERLKEKLEEKGIKCVHCTDRFDMVDGKVKIMGAYERMEPAIRKILSDNPSIEVVIDLHRDGIDESKRLVTTINGKPTAKLMFFNGLCRILDDGKLIETEGLSNPYVPDNLAFSFNMNLKAREMYDGLSRGIYLNAYRYSLHFLPKSTLIEIGAQNNTKEEIFNAVDLLADVIEKVIV